jgi:hypothetical protein
MSDIKQSKSILAKLLATENLTVEHRSVATASFDTHNRILTLPVWDNTSDDVYDLLVGHEVGHAIYTPDLVGSDINLPQSYLNIVEDARIEKLMKRKYPGLARAFYRGYSELNEADFFEIQDIDVNTLKFIDRINLYFKLGNVNSGTFIDFSNEEQVFVNKISLAETFDDVVNIVKELVEHTQQEMEMEVQISIGDSNDSDGEQEQMDSQSDESQDSQVTDKQSKSSPTEGTDKKEDSPADSTQSSTNNPGTEQDFSSKTDEAWSKNQKQLATINNNNYLYLLPPEINVDNHIINWKEFGEDLPLVFKEIISQASTSGYNGKQHYISMLNRAESGYKKYKEESKKSVSYLIKEFEMKKRATEYNRSATAGTGILDTNKMYSYKWNDDIFKRVTVVPKGKSHGLIMYIDWSGSMQGNLVGTVKQLFNLIQFCKKTQVPFEVYSFNDKNVAKNYAKMSRSKTLKINDNQIYISNDFLLVNFLSSKMNTAQLEKQMNNIWKLAYILDNRAYLPYEYGHYDLGSTPLNECVFAAIPLFDKFKKTYKVDKVNTVFLTDGESNSVSFNRPSYHGQRNIVHAGWLQHNDILCFQDKKNKITMMNITKNGSIGVTSSFVEYYRQVTGSNAVGFRLIDYYEAKSFVARHLKDEYPSWNSVSAEWSKTKSFTSTSMGYNELYFIQIGNTTPTEDDQSQIPTTGNVTTAFKTQMGKKAYNKIILSKFVEQIA